MSLDDCVQGGISGPLRVPFARHRKSFVVAAEPVQTLRPLHACVHETWVEGAGTHEARLGGGKLTEAEMAKALIGVES